MEDGGFLLDESARAESVALFFRKLFSSFFAGLFPQGYLESTSQVLEDWSIAFVSTLMAFFKASSQKSRLRPRASN